MFNDEEVRFASYASSFIGDKMAHQHSKAQQYIPCPYKDFGATAGRRLRSATPHTDTHE